MNAALTVALRDLRERRNMLLLSVALTLVPFLAAAMPAARSDRPGAIGVVSLVLAVGFAFGTAIALGSSVVSGDLAQRRISFYFARPLSSAAIWFGKTLGALLASFLGFLIIVLPALILASTWGGMAVSRWSFVGICTGGILIFFLVSHTVSTSIRSRSPLIVADLLLALVTIFAIYHLVRPLLLGGGVQIVGLLAAVIGVAMMGILAAAPVWQLARGRADIRRSHAALSKVAWASILIVLLLAGGYVAWVISPSPSKLTKWTEISQSSSGKMAAVAGFAKGHGDYNSTFLLNVETGEHTRLKSPLWWGNAWSRDGSTFAWFESAQLFSWRRAPSLELYTKREGSGEIVVTGINAKAPARVVLSDDGTRAAIFSEGKVVIHDLARKQILAAASLRQQGLDAMFFVTPDSVRLFQVERERVRILELDAANGSLATTGEFAVSGHSGLPSSADGSRVLVRFSGQIIDGKTGKEIATLAADARNHRVRMLSDGRLVLFVPEPGESRIEMYSRDGAASGTIALAGIDSGWVSGEMADGKLLVMGVRKILHGKSRRDMLVIDPQSGAIEKRLEGLRGPTPQWGLDPRFARYAAGTTFLAIDDSGKLIAWNSATGERKPLQR
jgi:hypothetical protein